MTPAFGLRQFVHLGGHDMAIDAKPLQPVPCAAIDLQAGMPAVDEHEYAATARVRRSRAEVRCRERIKLVARRVATAGISVARQVDEVERRFPLDSDPIEVGEARLARCGARAR